MRLSLSRLPLLGRALGKEGEEEAPLAKEGGPLSATGSTRSRRSSSKDSGDACSAVAVVRDLPYGPRPRNR